MQMTMGETLKPGGYSRDERLIESDQYCIYVIIRLLDPTTVILGRIIARFTSVQQAGTGRGEKFPPAFQRFTRSFRRSSDTGIAADVPF